MLASREAVRQHVDSATEHTTASSSSSSSSRQSPVVTQASDLKSCIRRDSTGARLGVTWSNIEKCVLTVKPEDLFFILRSTEEWGKRHPQTESPSQAKVLTGTIVATDILMRYISEGPMQTMLNKLVSGPLKAT